MANDLTLTVAIERMGMHGEGIGQTPDGRLAFVRNGLPGETVEARITEVRKNFVRAVATEHYKQSPNRQVPPCPIYASCGGCALQHWSYSEELAYKENRVRQALIRIGGLSNPPVGRIKGAEHDYFYRNKGQFPWGGSADRPTLGLYQRGSHDVVPVGDCAIQDPLINEVLAAAPALATRYHLGPFNARTGEGVLRHLLIRSSRHANETLALLVVGQEPNDLVERFAQDLMQACPHLVGVGINRQSHNTNRVLGPETRTVAGKTHIVEEILGMRFWMSFTSFFQVNPEQVQILYQLVLEALGSVQEVWDLYAGVGTLAALASRSATRVRALEMHPAAIQDARRNFDENGLTSVDITQGTVENVVAQWVKASDHPPDAVIMDPPRAGLKPEVVQSLLTLKPKLVVYVSCNPDTLGRDVALLSQQYDLKLATPVDMFPRTDHVESCAVLVRH